MSLVTALAAWREVLGVDRVIEHGEALEAARITTHLSTGQVLAVIRPRSVSEVQRCLEVAAAHGASVYPTSRGKSWGLGSQVPPRDATLLDLQDLQRITSYDERLGSVEVEPGVSFQQLYDFLKAKRSRFFLNVTGSSPHGSVLGNAIERGDGAGPYADRFSHIAHLEVALAPRAGEPSTLVQTGFAGFPASAPGLSAAHRWGVGPVLDGLFSQSNLGVVTRLCLWLRPLPRSLHVLRFGIKDPARLGPLTDALAELKLEGTLQSSIGVWNDYRVVSANARWPAEGAPGEALSRAALEAMPEWPGLSFCGSTAIYTASPEEGHARRLHVERCIGRLVDQLRWVEASGEAFAGRELLVPNEPAFKFLQGIPHEHSLRSAYWRMPAVTAAASSPGDAPLDLGRDGCGVIWACASVPFIGRDVARATRAAEVLLTGRGFEPLLAWVAQSERCIYLIPLIVYDRTGAGNDERAFACHDALYQAFGQLGYLPYRLGAQSMHHLPEPTPERRELAQRLKQALDPEGVIAPGRYEW
ncbi:MAG: FAD-binding oxidoreductase [Polyangiaceae bacterium]|nr:FAD-binding oxidoreductase [Polyangiaceae bacterium]MCW5792272.1 FAD-binding oxidoreductase [Polyangiaceae bacterium]